MLNPLVVLENLNFYRIVFLLAHICQKTIKKPKLNRVKVYFFMPKFWIFEYFWCNWSHS